MYLTKSMRFLTQSLATTLSLSLILTSSSLAEVTKGPGPRPMHVELAPPPRLGYVVDHFDAETRRGGDTENAPLPRFPVSPRPPLVILIQDLHAHYGVQKNIAGILGFLAEKLPKSSMGVGEYGSKGVTANSRNPLTPLPDVSATALLPFALAVEGATGPIDTSVLARFPDSKIKQSAADYLMKQGELSGAEYFSVIQGHPQALVGVEDDTFYSLHRDLFRKTYSQRDHYVRLLEGMQNDLNDLKRQSFSKKLKILDRRMDMYRQDRLSLSRLLQTLESEARRQGFDASAVRRSKPEDLQDNLASLAFMLKLQMAKTPMEKDLIQVEHDLGLLVKVADLRATEKEVRTFGPRLNQFVALADALLSDTETRRRGDAVKNQYNIPVSPSPRVPVSMTSRETELRELVSSSIDYYALAMARNPPMVEKTLALLGVNRKGVGEYGSRGVTANGRDPLTPQPPYPPTAVLITGGFHTAPITKLLKAQKIPYLVITPAVDRITDADHALYVKRLNGDWLTVQDVLADASLRGRAGESRLARLWPLHRQADSLAVGVGIISGAVGLATFVQASGLSWSDFATHFSGYLHDPRVALYVSTLVGAIGIAFSRPSSPGASKESGPSGVQSPTREPVDDFRIEPVGLLHQYRLQPNKKAGQSQIYIEEGRQRRIKVFTFDPALKLPRVTASHLRQYFDHLSAIRAVYGRVSAKAVQVVSMDPVQVPSGEYGVQIPYIKGKDLQDIIQNADPRNAEEMREIHRLKQAALDFLDRVDALTDGLADRRPGEAPGTEDFSNFIVPSEFVGPAGRLILNGPTAPRLVNIDPLNMGNLVVRSMPDLAAPRPAPASLAYHIAASRGITGWPLKIVGIAGTLLEIYTAVYVLPGIPGALTLTGFYALAHVPYLAKAPQSINSIAMITAILTSYSFAPLLGISALAVAATHVLFDLYQWRVPNPKLANRSGSQKPVFRDVVAPYTLPGRVMAWGAATVWVQSTLNINLYNISRWILESFRNPQDMDLQSRMHVHPEFIFQALRGTVVGVMIALVGYLLGSRAYARQQGVARESPIDYVDVSDSEKDVFEKLSRNGALQEIRQLVAPESREFRILRIASRGEGVTKYVFRVVADTDHGEKVFALRLYREANAVTGEPNFGVISKEIGRFRALKSAERRRPLTVRIYGPLSEFLPPEVMTEKFQSVFQNNQILGITIGEFNDGNTLDREMNPGRLMEAMRKNIELLIEAWLCTMSQDSRGRWRGFLIDDLKRENFVEDQETKEVLFLDLDNVSPTMPTFEGLLVEIYKYGVAVLAGQDYNGQKVFRMDATTAAKDETKLSGLMEGVTEGLVLHILQSLKDSEADRREEILTLIRNAQKSFGQGMTKKHGDTVELTRKRVLYGALENALRRLDESRTSPSTGPALPEILPSPSAPSKKREDLQPTAAQVHSRSRSIEGITMNQVVSWVRQYLPSEFHRILGIPNLPVGTHREGPAHGDHLLALFRARESLKRNSQIPERYRQILNDPANNEFFRLFILLHDLGKTTVTPSTIVEEGNTYTLYAGHEQESYRLATENPHIQKLVAGSSHPEALLVAIRLHGALYGVSHEPVSAESFENFIGTHGIPVDQIDEIIPFLIASSLIDVHGTTRADPWHARPLNFAKGYEAYRQSNPPTAQAAPMVIGLMGYGLASAMNAPVIVGVLILTAAIGMTIWLFRDSLFGRKARTVSVNRPVAPRSRSRLSAPSLESQQTDAETLQAAIESARQKNAILANVKHPEDQIQRWLETYGAQREWVFHLVRRTDGRLRVLFDASSEAGEGSYLAGRARNGSFGLNAVKALLEPDEEIILPGHTHRIPRSGAATEDPISDTDFAIHQLVFLPGHGQPLQEIRGVPAAEGDTMLSSWKEFKLWYGGARIPYLVKHGLDKGKYYRHFVRAFEPSLLPKARETLSKPSTRDGIERRAKPSRFRSEGFPVLDNSVSDPHGGDQTSPIQELRSTLRVTDLPSSQRNGQSSNGKANRNTDDREGNGRTASSKGERLLDRLTLRSTMDAGLQHYQTHRKDLDRDVQKLAHLREAGFQIDPTAHRVVDLFFSPTFEESMVLKKGFVDRHNQPSDPFNEEYQERRTETVEAIVDAVTMPLEMAQHFLLEFAEGLGFTETMAAKAVEIAFGVSLGQAGRPNLINAVMHFLHNLADPEAPLTAMGRELGPRRNWNRKPKPVLGRRMFNMLVGGTAIALAGYSWQDSREADTTPIPPYGPQHFRHEWLEFKREQEADESLSAGGELTPQRVAAINAAAEATALEPALIAGFLLEEMEEQNQGGLRAWMRERVARLLARGAQSRTTIGLGQVSLDLMMRPELLEQLHDQQNAIAKILASSPEELAEFQSFMERYERDVKPLKNEGALKAQLESFQPNLAALLEMEVVNIFMTAIAIRFRANTLSEQPAQSTIPSMEVLASPSQEWRVHEMAQAVPTAPTNARLLAYRNVYRWDVYPPWALQVFVANRYTAALNSGRGLRRGLRKVELYRQLLKGDPIQQAVLGGVLGAGSSDEAQKNREHLNRLGAQLDVPTPARAPQVGYTVEDAYDVDAAHERVKTKIGLLARELQGQIKIHTFSSAELPYLIRGGFTGHALVVDGQVLRNRGIGTNDQAAEDFLPLWLGVTGEYALTYGLQSKYANGKDQPTLPVVIFMQDEDVVKGAFKEGGAFQYHNFHLDSVQAVRGILQWPREYFDKKNAQSLGYQVAEAYLDKILAIIRSDASPAQEQAAAPVATSKPVIVLAEDEEDLREIWTEVLTPLGYEVVAKADGKQALEYLSQHPAALLITDIDMPYMRGDELIALVRARNPTMPIMVMTGDSQKDALQLKEEYPDLEVLLKPVQISVMQEAVNRALPRTPGSQSSFSSLTVGELLDHLRPHQVVAAWGGILFNRLRAALSPKFRKHLFEELLTTEAGINRELEAKGEKPVTLRPYGYDDQGNRTVSWMALLLNLGRADKTEARTLMINPYLSSGMKLLSGFHETLHIQYSGWSESEVIKMAEVINAAAKKARKAQLAQLPETVTQAEAAAQKASPSARLQDLIPVVSQILSRRDISPQKAHSVSQALDPHRLAFLASA